jgi:hypothetical protein
MDDGDTYQLRDELEDIGYDTSDGIPGWTYDPNEAAWLCAIQQSFARLYSAVAERRDRKESSLRRWASRARTLVGMIGRPHLVRP